MSTFVGADPDRLWGAADRLVDLAKQTATIEARLGRVRGPAGAGGRSAEAYARVPALLSQLGEVAAAVHRDAQLLKDRALAQGRKSTPAHVPVARAQPQKYNKYRIGPPTAPTIPHHDAFPYDPSQRPTLDDYLNRKKWMAKLWGAKVLRSDLKDAVDAYYHYWFGEGKPLSVDYEKAYREDSVIRKWADQELENARWAAETLYLKSGRSSFRMSGDLVSVSEDPATEDWQKTIGQHHMWVNADVRVEGRTVTAVATVNARDWYNFNPDAIDLATGERDRVNGRFHTLGWAKEFMTQGSLIRVMTWTVGHPDKAQISVWKPQPPIPTPAPTPVPAPGTSR